MQQCPMLKKVVEATGSKSRSPRIHILRLARNNFLRKTRGARAHYADAPRAESLIYI